MRLEFLNVAVSFNYFVVVVFFFSPFQNGTVISSCCTFLMSGLEVFKSVLRGLYCATKHK
jgi:hypothetical protein